MSSFAGLLEPRRTKQTGVVLFISLIVLVAMSLAGIALMRAMGSGLLVAGNLSFKRATTSAGDFGIELGRDWLIRNAANLNAHRPSDGYYADWVGPDAPANATPYDWNPLTMAWNDNTSSDIVTDAQGNRVRFVVHRLCAPGTVGADPRVCVTVAGPGGGGSMASPDDMKWGLGGGNLVYYRVTAQVTGPKNTVSYVQAIVF